MSPLLQPPPCPNRACSPPHMQGLDLRYNGVKDAGVITPSDGSRPPHALCSNRVADVGVRALAPQTAALTIASTC
eukprot:6983944-Pyramimonas_sp.AAC.1